MLANHSGLGNVCIRSVTMCPGSSADKSSIYRVSKMAEQGKVLAAKTNDLSFNRQPEFDLLDP